MITADLFEDEERQYLNALADGMSQKQLTRDEVLSCVSFAREIADSMDTQILSLLDGVYSKIYNLADNEWDILKRQIPFPTLISADDLDDEDEAAFPMGDLNFLSDSTGLKEQGI